ncbi:MAG: hypothetical protein AUI36_01790 [Cyanobacteria bacterium 13_1_40CM_2_61_4]|nr:MAG: hypothetical protein AUI36_01790 [Cyanobacteria bacterium 13_1_40CM_2_61_4]
MVRRAGTDRAGEFRMEELRVGEFRVGEFRAGASPAPTFQVNILHHLLLSTMLTCGAFEKSINLIHGEKSF